MEGVAQAISVEASSISSPEEPIARKALLVRLVVVEIARSDVGPSDADFSFFDFFVGLEVEDADFDALAETDGAGFSLSVKQPNVSAESQMQAEGASTDLAGRERVRSHLMRRLRHLQTRSSASRPQRHPRGYTQHTPPRPGP